MILKVGFDIGGVISKYPAEFKAMMQALQAGGAEVFIITDMPRETSLRTLQENGFEFVPGDHVLNADYDAHGEDCKAVLLKERGIHIHVDDLPGYCAHTDAISLFLWPNTEKPYYHDDFKTESVTFGRSKKSRPR